MTPYEEYLQCEKSRAPNTRRPRDPIIDDRENRLFAVVPSFQYIVGGVEHAVGQARTAVPAGSWTSSHEVNCYQNIEAARQLSSEMMEEFERERDLEAVLIQRCRENPAVHPWVLARNHDQQEFEQRKVMGLNIMILKIQSLLKNLEAKPIDVVRANPVPYSTIGAPRRVTSGVLSSQPSSQTLAAGQTTPAVVSTEDSSPPTSLQPPTEALLDPADIDNFVMEDPDWEDHDWKGLLKGIFATLQI